MKIINKYAVDNNKPLNLHLGCGTKLKDSYINIDLYDKSEGHEITPELHLDITRIDEYVEPCTVKKILMIHVLEHFNRWEAIELLNKFYNVLEKGGSLILEMPDLDGCIDFYINNKGAKHRTPYGKINRGLVILYGDQWSRDLHGTHKYLWRKEEFKKVLTDIGFSVLTLDNNVKSHVKKRDMRAVCEK